MFHLDAYMAAEDSEEITLFYKCFFRGSSKA